MDYQQDQFCYEKIRSTSEKKNCKMGTRTRQHNIVLHLPVPKGEDKKIGKNNIGSAWKLFVTEDMLKIILIHTNDKIMDRRCNLKNLFNLIQN